MCGSVCWSLEDGLCLPEVIRCMLLCMPEAEVGRLCLPEVIRCMLLWMLETVEGSLCLLEVFEVPEVMRCVLDTLCARHSACLMVGSVSGVRNFRCGSFLDTLPQPAAQPSQLRRS